MINNNLILTILDILINLIDVLVVILPVLLSVAFMTIIERKQLAAMQRRVGPNTVGGENIKKSLCQTKRFYHSSSVGNNNEIITALFKNRIAPVELFDSEVIDTCSNITSTEQRTEFFNKFNDKGGIYLIQYKDNPSIYYFP